MYIKDEFVNKVSSLIDRKIAYLLEWLISRFIRNITPFS